MHYFKLMGDPDGYRHLWENREALDRYLARLKELMESDEETEIKDSGRESPGSPPFIEFADP